MVAYVYFSQVIDHFVDVRSFCHFLFHFLPAFDQENEAVQIYSSIIHQLGIEISLQERRIELFQPGRWNTHAKSHKLNKTSLHICNEFGNIKIHGTRLVMRIKRTDLFLAGHKDVSQSEIIVRDPVRDGFVTIWFVYRLHKGLKGSMSLPENSLDPLEATLSLLKMCFAEKRSYAGRFDLGMEDTQLSAC